MIKGPSPSFPLILPSIYANVVSMGVTKEIPASANAVNTAWKPVIFKPKQHL